MSGRCGHTATTPPAGPARGGARSAASGCAAGPRCAAPAQREPRARPRWSPVPPSDRRRRRFGRFGARSLTRAPRIDAPWPATGPGRPRPVVPELEQQVLERWRERDVFHESMRRREGAAAVRLLRGPAHRQRAARLAPRAQPRLQGRLPALQDDARPLRAPQGRLGLPRPAGRARDRAGARLQGEGRHRALRRRRVQRSAASRCCATSTSGTR